MFLREEFLVKQEDIYRKLHIKPEDEIGSRMVATFFKQVYPSPIEYHPVTVLGGSEVYSMLSAMDNNMKIHVKLGVVPINDIEAHYLSVDRTYSNGKSFADLSVESLDGQSMKVSYSVTSEETETPIPYVKWLNTFINDLIIPQGPTDQKNGYRSEDKYDLLTEREREVIDLLSIGWSNDEISKKLVISTSTTKVHVKNIFNKLGMKKRVEATRVWTRMQH